MIDVRCPVLAPTPTRGDDAARCQLLAGHEDAHAAMFCRAGRRVVRTWTGHDPLSVRDHHAGQEPLPWVLGMPVPAWSEGT